MLFSEPGFVLVLLSQETQSFQLKRGIVLGSQVIPPAITPIAVAVLFCKLLDISVPTDHSRYHTKRYNCASLELLKTSAPLFFGFRSCGP